MPLLISFKFSPALWRIFARFAIACISGHKWRTLKGRQGERDLPRVGGWGEEIRRDGWSCFRVKRKRLSCIKELRYSSLSLSSASVFPRSLFRFRFCSQFSGGLKIKRKSFTTWLQSVACWIVLYFHLEFDSYNSEDSVFWWLSKVLYSFTRLSPINGDVVLESSVCCSGAHCSSTSTSCWLCGASL